MRNILTLPTIFFALTTVQFKTSQTGQSEKLLPKLRGSCIVILDADTI
jgi:hypothetical protein